VIQIPHRWRPEPVYTSEKETLFDAVVEAVTNGASLDGASLVGASLDGARLVGASLVGASLVGARLNGARLDGASLDGASLDGARLDGARLVGASLVGARLDGARLDGARLVGARLNWQSHWLLAELLRRDLVERLDGSNEDGEADAADLTQDDLDRFAVIGVILSMRDWCWGEFLAVPVRPEVKDWAINVFARYRIDGDNAPATIVKAWKRLQDAKTPTTEGVATDGR